MRLSAVLVMASIAMSSSAAEDGATVVATMSPENLRAFNDIRLSRDQADALTPLIQRATTQTHSMLKREMLRTRGYPVQRTLVRKARAIFSKLDDDVQQIIREDQWQAWQGFKSFAAEEICTASFEIRIKPEGQSVVIEVIPE